MRREKSMELKTKTKTSSITVAREALPFALGRGTQLSGRASLPARWLYLRTLPDAVNTRPTHGIRSAHACQTTCSRGHEQRAYGQPNSEHRYLTRYVSACACAAQPFSSHDNTIRFMSLEIRFNI